MGEKNIVINIVVDKETLDGISELQAVSGMSRSAIMRKLVQRERDVIRYNAAISRPLASPDIEEFFREMRFEKF